MSNKIYAFRKFDVLTLNREIFLLCLILFKIIINKEMSLVAYSDESNSDSEEEELQNDLIIPKISLNINKRFILPLPKNSIEEEKINNNSTKVITELSFNLPEPITSQLNILESEEEDEFLKKKATSVIPKPRLPVRIAIPSLSDFKDEENMVNVITTSQKSSNKGFGLLALLPKPKSEIIFQSSKDTDQFRKQNPFIPHSITSKNKLTPQNAKSTKNVQKNKSNIITSYSDSEESETEDGNVNSSVNKVEMDFFSLNSVDKLPEISENEINIMVAKKAAKIAAAASKFDEVITPEIENKVEDNYSETVSTNNTNLDKEALQILCGSSAKRKKHGEVNFVDISHDQVMPSKNDWMRSALASSTEYQPRGNLADDDLTPGSKRKHQITYLAHQAKANEQELQAMWAQNRQSRRQTQSKYGF